MISLLVSQTKYSEIQTKFNAVELTAENGEVFLLTNSGMTFFKSKAGDKDVLV